MIVFLGVPLRSLGPNKTPTQAENPLADTSSLVCPKEGEEDHSYLVG